MRIPNDTDGKPIQRGQTYVAVKGRREWKDVPMKVFWHRADDHPLTTTKGHVMVTTEEEEPRTGWIPAWYLRAR